MVEGSIEGDEGQGSARVGVNNGPVKDNKAIYYRNKK